MKGTTERTTNRDSAANHPRILCSHTLTCTLTDGYRLRMLPRPRRHTTNGNTAGADHTQGGLAALHVALRVASGPERI